jgi:catechol 2,3-dioxygenase-like lactoylglutathione lyase family enzyme
MDWTLEVVVLPVSDIDRSIAFYRDQVGFVLDHDTRTEHMHVAQLTPVGSGCSIVIGDLPAQNEMAPGSMRGLQLCVADAAAAREELRPGSRGKRDHRHRRARRGHLLRVQRSGRQHLGGPAAQVRATMLLIPVDSRGRFGAG